MYTYLNSQCNLQLRKYSQIQRYIPGTYTRITRAAKIKVRVPLICASFRHSKWTLCVVLSRFWDILLFTAALWILEWNYPVWLSKTKEHLMMLISENWPGVNCMKRLAKLRSIDINFIRMPGGRALSLISAAVFSHLNTMLVTIL